jgi:O-antigen/teichoic acid export membrane protein
LYRDAVFTFAVRLLSLVLGLGVSIFLARALGPEGMGIYALTMLLPTLVLRLVSLGVEPATIYYVSQGRHFLKDILASNLLFSVSCGVIGLGVGALAVQFPQGDFFRGIDRNYLLIALAVIPGSLIAANLGAILIGLQRFGENNLINLIRSFSMAIFIVAIVWLGKGGIRGALLATVASWALVDILLLFRTRNLAGEISFSKESDYIRKASFFGFQAQLGSIIGFINYRVDLFLVNAFLDPSQAGFYAVSSGIAEGLWLISGTACTLLYPVISQDSGGERRPHISPLFARIVLELTLLAALGVLAFGNYFVRLIFSPTFIDSVMPLYLLLPGVVAMSVSQVLTADISGRGKVIWNTYAVSFAAAINIALNIFLIPRYGISGAAIASSVSYSLSAAIRVIMFCYLSGNALSTLLPRRSDWDVFCKAYRILPTIFSIQKQGHLQERGLS